MVTALESGHPAGEVGGLVTSVVKVTDLSRAINAANAAAVVAPLSRHAQQLLATANVIKSLRECVKVDDWDGTRRNAPPCGRPAASVVLLPCLPVPRPCSRRGCRFHQTPWLLLWCAGLVARRRAGRV